MTAHRQIEHLLELKRWNEAIERIRPLLAADPEDHRLHALHAAALDGLDKMREARRAIKRAISLAPDVSWYHAQFGEILVRIRMDVEAHKEFEEAIRLDPHSMTAQYAYAHAILQDPRIEQAFLQNKLKRRVRDLTANLIAGWPDDPVAHIMSARVHLMDNELQAADHATVQALRLAPNWAYAHQIRGEVLEAQGRAGEAGEAYVSSGKLDPTNSTSRSRLAGMFAGEGLLNEKTALGLMAFVFASRLVSDGGNLWVALLLFVVVTALVVILIVRYRARRRETRAALSPLAQAIATDGRRRFRLK